MCAGTLIFDFLGGGDLSGWLWCASCVVKSPPRHWWELDHLLRGGSFNLQRPEVGETLLLGAVGIAPCRSMQQLRWAAVSAWE